MRVMYGSCLFRHAFSTDTFSRITPVQLWKRKPTASNDYELVHSRADQIASNGWDRYSWSWYFGLCQAPCHCLMYIMHLVPIRPSFMLLLVSVIYLFIAPIEYSQFVSELLTACLNNPFGCLFKYPCLKLLQSIFIMTNRRRMIISLITIYPVFSASARISLFSNPMAAPKVNNDWQVLVVDHDIAWIQVVVREPQKM